MKLRDENGQTLIFVALSLTCLLGFVALAADVGTMFYAKRELQTAADTAAVAGASALKYGGNVVTAAKAAAAQNGFTDGAGGVVVSVSPTGPLYGPHAGDPSYVEAIVTAPQNTLLMGLFSGQKTTTVAARAVAFHGAPGTACVYALHSTGSDTIHLQGSFDVSVPDCQVVDDSSDANALYFTGAGGTLTAGSIGVVGGVGGKVGDSSPAPITKIAPVSDPLSDLTPPTYSSCTAVPSGTTWGPATAGGTVCYSGNISIKNNVSMNPGTYVFTGNLDLGGGGSLTSIGGPTGTGAVTLYFPPGGSLGGGGNGNTTLNLTAPTSGTYNGILIYEDASNTTAVSLNGTPIANLTGIIYAPNAELDLSGNTTVNLVSDLIVGSLYDKGNASINLKNYSAAVTTSPLTSVALVE